MIEPKLTTRTYTEDFHTLHQGVVQIQGSETYLCHHRRHIIDVSTYDSRFRLLCADCNTLFEGSQAIELAERNQ